MELRVARGGKVVRVDLSAGDRPPDGELVKLMVSRWGKLRAPTLKVGATLVVGYNRDMLASVFGEVLRPGHLGDRPTRR